MESPERDPGMISAEEAEMSEEEVVEETGIPFSSPDAPSQSIVDYFYPVSTEGHRCGYCKSLGTSFCDGMWAYTLSVENYETLLNLGWSRSGCYLYKPRNEKVCCPLYTIRHFISSIRFTKSQVKVLKKFRKFIEEGVVDAEGEAKNCKPVKINDNKSNQEEHNGSTNSSPKQSNGNGGDHVFTDSDKMESSDNNHQDKARFHPNKKKHLRRERKRQKLIAKGQNPDEFFKRGETGNQSTFTVNDLGKFFDFDNMTSVKHNFRTRLVAVDGPEYDDQELAREHQLYKKYQMHTHGNTESECNIGEFKRFQCDNPFIMPRVKGKLSGTYHQQYYIDDNLVAVGVLDILTSIVSAAYFFYDPDYKHLNLGKLGALYELSFINGLRKDRPAIQYYYMGYYVHNCVKMRYKRDFKPCQLLCPITLTWVDFNDSIYQRIEDCRGGCIKLASGESIEDNQNTKDDDVTKVLLLHNSRIYTYENYVRKEDEGAELQSFVNLTTEPVASKLLLLRS